VSIKAGVVSKDEKETLGVRILLNYGHTIGHAIEASTHYERYFHGEAVSIGMMGSALISNGLGMLSKQDVDRQKILLESFGLPVSCSGLDPLQLHQTMQMDKKKSGGQIRWVLLDEIGRAVTRNDVSRDLVDSVLKDLCR
jgi:3-dehydroquinate synthase